MTAAMLALDTADDELRRALSVRHYHAGTRKAAWQALWFARIARARDARFPR